MPQIVQMIDNARFLVELDLSWSQITPFMMLNLTTHLAENRQLQVVNLSWNQITSHTIGAKFDDDRHPDEVQIKE